MEKQEITVLADYVLVKQTMTSKTKKIIALEGTRNKEDAFDFSFEIVQKGAECKREGINIGDKPIFEKHVQFEGVKVVDKTPTTMTSLVIVHENSIIAIDNTVEEVAVQSELN